MTAALLKARNALHAGRTIVGHWHGSGCPLLAETVTATSDYDVLVVDCQHGIIDAPAAMAVMASVRNASPFVRLRDTSAAHIHHALDAGAMGLIAPLINTADDARAFVCEAMYPPLGSRSFGPVRASLLGLGGPGGYFASANESVLCWAMIETAAALHNVEQIAAVPGVHGVFIGPNDLSLSLGVPPSSNPQDPAVLQSIAKIRAAAHSASKKAGIFCGDGAFARRMADEGFDFVIAGTDTGLLQMGAARELEAVRAGGGGGGKPAY
ncbi:hypothetical protein KFE25_004731 [Diacronema lutheri]|uniref:HpcH/HpaI aldolase/citrate lyase domain-containing protein n=1 Tax=Diacronema lutheri TaxID=2081491 RepID=A0A8J6CAM1_DIALT|nr:hypothetical protein KFE25_004731 [Diacronema lutheri]|mmetsp:Transcript_21130/g.65587  ORF Transcript_21130/g.65587 Transcript_21130/m.65587 type:complete len:267 (-) Transcript_21130:33-833(-)